jgi:phosphoribosylamine--glycine ligase
MARLKSDLVDLCLATIEGRLDSFKLKWDPRPAVCVVMASGGYPGTYHKHIPISGIEAAQAMDDIVVFHAGTIAQHGQVLTNGGRVLGVTGLGDDIASAIMHTYEAVEKIQFDQMHFRWDIGAKAI